MPLRLHSLLKSNPADHALLAAIARIHLAAWLTNSAYQQVYYGPPSSYAGIIEANHQRHVQSFISNPTSHFVVVLDDDIRESDTDQHELSAQSPVISWIKYDVFDNAQVEEERRDTAQRTWPAHTNVALAQEFWKQIARSREKTGHALGAHISIDLLATDPRHHRRGAGLMLMQHVADKADELNLPSTIEASPAGLKLYQSVGFREVDAIWIDLLRFEDGGDKGGVWTEQNKRTPGRGPGWYEQVVMIRTTNPI